MYIQSNQINEYTISPSNHVIVSIQGYIWGIDVIVRAWVTIWRSKPFIEAVLQWQELRLVSEMPKIMSYCLLVTINLTTATLSPLNRVTI